MSRSWRKPSAAALALLCLAAGSADSFEPGAWEKRVDFVSATQDGKPIPDFDAPPADVKRRCVSAAVAADPARLVFPRDRSGCSTLSKSMAGGLVALTAKCTNPDGSAAEISAEGSYDRTGYTLDIVTEVPTPQGAAFITAKVTARRLGACTKDDQPIEQDPGLSDPTP